MAISSQGTTFVFGGVFGQFSAKATSITVEEAQQEIVDMTAIGGASGIRAIRATGDVVSPPKISIEWYRDADSDLSILPPGTASDALSTGQSGAVSIGHPNFSITEFAVIESASTELSVGNIVRGRATFILDRS